MESSLYGLASNADEAIAAARANMSPRQRELETLEKYAQGKQYEGLPDWFDESVPLWERAPCIRYAIAKSAITSNVDLVLGEGRFPIVTSNPNEDDSDADGLDREQSKKVDRALTELCRRVRFRSVSRSAMKHGQQAKSVAVIAGARKGRAFLEIVRARWCEPTFDEHQRVTRLEIRYPYIEWNKQPDGTFRLKALLYRRVIDAAADTTYLPLEADKNGKEPLEGAWQADPNRTVKHALGFCPVHWYAHMRECTTVADYDGEAVHQDILETIRALDFALSQRHRAALFAGDPQTVETGVTPGYNPSGQTGRMAQPGSAKGGQEALTHATSRYESTGPKTARVKSPGAVWQYEDKDTKVSYLVLPGEALVALDQDAADLRNKICEDLAYCPIDPHNVKFTGEMSGNAIAMLRARQFDRCDIYRDDVGDNWILPVVQLLLRVALKVKLAIKAIDDVRDILSKFVADDAAEPMLFLRWPAGYLKPDAQDENVTVTMATAALKGCVITKRMALQKVAPIFGVDNIDQAEQALKEEAAERQQQAMQVAGGGAGADPNEGAGGSAASQSPAGSSPNSPDPSPQAGAASPKSAVSSPKGAAAASAPAAAGASKAMQSPTAAKAAQQPASKPISQRGDSNSGVTESVHRLLLEDYPSESLAWVRAATWEGPIEVPLDEVDFSNQDQWAATDDAERVQMFVDRIKAGDRKPIVLVNEPNNEKLIIIDGHHRALAYLKLGQPVYGYVATVSTVTGQWDELHDSQRKKGKEAA